jgi:hypothetical protein
MSSLQTYSATAAASGAATITISPSTKARTWVISQVSIEVAGTAPFGAAAVMRVNGNLITPMVAQADAAGGDPPVTLYGSDTMTIVWSGLTSGQTVKATIIYDEEANR